MSKEYIERSAILDTLADPYRKASDEVEVAILKRWDRIKKIPAADVVEVRHARWINDCDEYFPDIKCERCGQRKPILLGNFSFNYCPNCGAKMDGGADDAAD